jgi:hypothetical protein
VKRPPVEYGSLPFRPDVTVCALAVLCPPLLRRAWRRWREKA